MINYIGYAVSHETHEVWMLESDYADRKSVYDNADRCISEAMGYACYVSDMEVHTPRAGESCAEYAELLAVDLVTGCDGVDTGYTFHDVPIMVSRRQDDAATIIKRYAREAKADVSAMLSLFDAWQAMHQERDEERAANEFLGFVNRMRSVY